MSDPTGSAQASETTAGITPGALIGGRFAVERQSHSDSFGATWLARDQKTGKPIAIRVLSPRLAEDPRLVEAVKAEVKTAAKAKHRVLAGSYGVGTHGGQLFVACEWAQGSSLAELGAERMRAGDPMTLRGAYNIIAHVGKSLAELHPSCHGALRPSIVMITKSGRVKVTGLGTDLALVRTGHARDLPADEQGFLAPEVRANGVPDARSDVFGLGGLLYALLTGRSPADAFVAPSQVHPDASPELDVLLQRCLAVQPAQRFASTQQVVDGLQPFVAAEPEPEAAADEGGIEVGVDVDIDAGLDIAVSIAPPMPASAFARQVIRATPVAFDPFASANGAPQRAMPPAPLPPAGPHSALQAKPVPPAPVAPAPTADLGALTAKLTQNDAPRWMTSKNGLDHGPFTARELIKLIVEGEFLPTDGLFNMSTDERKPLGEWREFDEFVHQYKLRKADADDAAALDKSTRTERRSNVFKTLILVGSIGAALLVGGGFLMSREAAKKREAAGEVDLSAMFEGGAVKIKGTAGILPNPPRGGGGKRGGGSTTGGGGPGFSSYEEAMNQAVELGDMRGGGERQLTSADVQGVMDRRLNSLFSCVSEELGRGGKLGSVQIDLAIMGSGQVAGASVSAGSGAFRGCIVAKLRSIKFPSFPAPRMGARYAFDVN